MPPVTLPASNTEPQSHAAHENLSEFGDKDIASHTHWATARVRFRRPAASAASRSTSSVCFLSTDAVGRYRKRSDQTSGPGRADIGHRRRHRKHVYLTAWRHAWRHGCS